MEHSEKLRRLEESRQQRRLGGMVIYPLANQLGCAMAPFAFPQLAEATAPHPHQIGPRQVHTIPESLAAS